MNLAWRRLSLACGLVLLLPLGAGAQESLTGSFVTFDSSVGGVARYTPGQSDTFCFRAESFTPDWEYVYYLWLRFPADWNITNVVVDDTPPACTSGGTFGSFSWWAPASNEIRINHNRYHQNPADHCTAYYCVTATAGGPGGSTPAPVSWYWAGTDLGSPPFHPCSSDGYTPTGQPACDEAVSPPAAVPIGLFTDGFETGDTSAWSATYPVPLRVALQAEPGSCLFASGEVFETVAALLTARGHTATFVTGVDLDTQLEISAFDVVVLGGPGAACANPGFPVFDGQVDAYVRGGGGLVAAGWTVWGTQLDGAPGIEATLPFERGSGFVSTATVNPVAGHPITAGLSSFVGQEYVIWGNGLKAGATVILQGGGEDLGAVWQLDAGRAVYLGPMFFEHFGSYQNESLLDGSQPDAVEIMLRSIEWAGGRL